MQTNHLRIIYESKEINLGIVYKHMVIICGMSINPGARSRQEVTSSLARIGSHMVLECTRTTTI